MTAVLLLGTGHLSGCAEIRESLGYEKTAPDEFQVIAHLPLQVPEILNLCPPARIGAQLQREKSPVQKAYQTLMNRSWPEGNGDAESTRTPEVRAFLHMVGTDRGWSDIRAVVDHEASTTLFDQRGIVDQMLFWREMIPEDRRFIDADQERYSFQESEN
ncbi:hypothetical protein RIEGSTA812A_PEG_514 [invertebrate metagenome]|uniref:Uncharacterized protein n=1 Tax=invertebrate metagenome TaxID=1711999 RepID=A0A484H6K5_9ZZZZ